MALYERDSIGIDRCPGCEYLWYDGGELLATHDIAWIERVPRPVEIMPLAYAHSLHDASSHSVFDRYREVTARVGDEPLTPLKGTKRRFIQGLNGSRLLSPLLLIFLLANILNALGWGPDLLSLFGLRYLQNLPGGL